MTQNVKTRVAVIFGGSLGEHSISCVTAIGVLEHIDRNRFEPVSIGITRGGAWALMSDEVGALRLQDSQGAEVTDNGTFVALVPQGQYLFFWDICVADSPIRDLGHIDVVMPLLHGPYGEDDTIQGLYEMVGVPYMGCGVTVSALCMDKGYTKQVLERGEIPVSRFHVVTDYAWRHRESAVPAKVSDFGLPVFVKPSRAGSSLGVSRVEAWEESEATVVAARRHDPKVIVEIGVVGAREVECAVLESRDGAAPRTTIPGEVVMKQTPGMCDFESKYFTQDAVSLSIPAQILEPVAKRICDYARQAFELISGEGLARVDFFYAEETGRLILSEVSTMPGTTPFSLFPGTREHTGMPYQDLMTELIEIALPCSQELRQGYLNLNLDLD